jgi:ABC-2 type transport system permease protein
MRNFGTLLRHEIRMLLVSPATYAAAVLFLALLGFLYWAIVRNMVESPAESLPAEQFYGLFWIPAFFVVPLLTMRSLAGERSIGTLDTLMTTPVSRGAVVLSKFAGAYLFYMALWAATLAFPWLTQAFFPGASGGEVLLARGPLAGAFIFLALSGVLFIAIGIFSSSLTRSQLVAAMLTFTALFAVVVGGQQLGQAGQMEGGAAAWLEGVSGYLEIFRHLEDFCRGVVDTRPFFYYLSTGGLLLGLSTLVVEAKA